MPVSKMQFRRGTAAHWASSNPVLGQAEPGVELGTGKMKFGDGTSPWNDLPYASAGPQGPAGVADDASVKELIEDPTSETATVLSATYATPASVAALTVGKADATAPAGVTGGPFTKGYDKRRSVYNLKPTHLQRARAAAGKALAGTGFFNLAFAGDSTVGGVGGVPSVSSWPDFLHKLLVSAGYPSAGTGMVAAWKSAAKDARWGTVPAAWGALSSSSSLLTNSTTSDPLVLTSTTAGTVAMVHYARTSGVFTVSIDGGAPVTVTPAGGNAMATYTVTGLANTTHTISIVRSSGNAQIFAAEVQANAYGVRLYNAGIGGSKIANAADSSWFGVSPIAAAASGFNADLAMFLTEVNDAGVTAVATYKASAQQCITNLKANGADVVIVTAFPPATDISAYTQALYELADSNDIPLIDFQDLFGNYARANALGLMSDGLHPNPAGYGQAGRAVFNALGL